MITTRVTRYKVFGINRTWVHKIIRIWVYKMSKLIIVGIWNIIRWVVWIRANRISNSARIELGDI